EYSALAARLVGTTLLHHDPLAELKIARIRASMTPAEQTLLILRIDKGLGWDEIATVLSVEEPVDAATLRKRFERLKKRLLEQAPAVGLDADAGRERGAPPPGPRARARGAGRPRARPAAGALRDRRPARQRRHGRGAPRARHPPRARRRHQGRAPWRRGAA